MSSGEIMPGEESGLLSRCLEGDGEALAALREQLQPWLLKSLRAKGASPEEAEDILADVWHRCVPGPNPEEQPTLLEKFRGRSSLRGWLLAVATNRLIDMKRRQHIYDDDHGITEKAAPNEPGSAWESALADLLRDALQAAFRQVPSETMLMLRLVYLHNLTQREVGRMWGWHESKVSRHLHQALADIRDSTLTRIRERDAWLRLEWEDLMNLCETCGLESLR